MLTISSTPKPFRGRVATIERFGANQRGGNRKHVLERIVPWLRKTATRRGVTHELR